MPDQNASQNETEAYEKTQKIAEAGGAAAEKGDDPAKAMKQERDRVQLDIPDEQIDRIADVLSQKNIAALEQRGAFDTPPEPVKGPDEAEGAPEHPRDEPARPADDTPPPAPVQKTWAHRFLGV